MATTIYAPTLTTNDSGYGGLGVRIKFPPSANALDQVRATYKAHGSQATNVNNASIGIQDTGISNHNFAALASPGLIELKFSGVSGFTLAAGAADLVSDWVNFSGFTTSNKLLHHHDFGATSWARITTSGPLGGLLVYGGSGLWTYSTLDLGSVGTGTAWDSIVLSLVEVQSVATGQPTIKRGGGITGMYGGRFIGGGGQQVWAPRSRLAMPHINTYTREILWAPSRYVDKPPRLIYSSKWLKEAA